MPGRADALASELEETKAKPATRERLDEIEKSFTELEPRLDELSARIDAALRGTPELDQLEDMRRELTAGGTPLSSWHEWLEAEAQRVATALEKVEQEGAIWSATLARAETADADESVARRVGETLQLIGETTGALRAWRNRVLAFDDRVLQRRTAVANTLARVHETANAERTSLFVPDRPPIWRTGYASALQRELPQIPGKFGEFAGKNFEYVASDPRPLIAQVLLVALLALGLHRVGSAARRRAADSPDLTAAIRVLDRPIAIATLLGLLTTPWLHPLAPRRFLQVFTLIALIAIARVVSHTSRETSRLGLVGLFGLIFLDRLALAFEELPSISQTIFLLEIALAIGLAIRVLQHGGLLSNLRRRWVQHGAQIALAAFAIALVAEIGGWSRLSGLLGRGGMVAALSAVYVWVAVSALEALLVWTLHSPRWSRLVRGGRLARQLIHWGGAGVWAYLVVVTLGQRESVAGALRAVFDAGISIGALSVTLGGVLSFALTIAAAPALARVINAVLEEAVYPRARLSRGVPYALSTMVRYAVFTVAFIAALAAAGVQLSQLSILIGGLGVGLGLGLQDFVKNFAAGLTLLFERRVHVGDAVQIPSREIFGRVIEIGMRAVVIRNWDGADVIVPNMDLITVAVTNWTLSDELRRIEVPVGVAYGSDPERVVSLLCEVAQSHADILESPAPVALFLGFGQSTLDFVLRAWSDREYDRTGPIRSQLVLATYRALREAGIEIPFPQRDLHLASVSPAVRSAFGAKPEE